MASVYKLKRKEKKKPEGAEPKQQDEVSAKLLSVDDAVPASAKKSEPVKKKEPGLIS